MLVAEGGYSVTDLGNTLLGASTDALPYIGAGVAAGAILFGVVVGIRFALRFMAGVSGDTAAGQAAFDAWERDKWASKGE